MARSATTEPTLPQPMTPSTFPVSSTPMNFDFSHFPAWVERSAAGSCRASASISAMACSAVVIELPKGVFITTMPRWVAAATPMPARPITLSRFAAAITGLVTLVAERTARPSNSATTCLSSSGVSLVLTTVSTPRSLKTATARGLNSSEISTLGMVATGSGGCSAANFVEGPVEPRQQCLDVAGFDRGSAPEAQTRRRVAMASNVVGHAFGVEQRLDAFHLGALRVGCETEEPVVHDLETDRRARPDLGVDNKEVEPFGSRHPARDRRQIGFAARLERRESANRLGPFEANVPITDAILRRRVIVSS